jgi:tRNA 2-thiouridine synthesizing protein A
MSRRSGRAPENPDTRGSGEDRALDTRVDAAWDAGDLGCGELVLELRARVAALQPGQVLKLTALDPGAPADLPAWCRLTGHALVAAEHPVYLIRHKED